MVGREKGGQQTHGAFLLTLPSLLKRAPGPGEQQESMSEAPNPSFLVETEVPILTEYSAFLCLVVTWSFSVTEELHVYSNDKGGIILKVRF